jgi:hypothetical protein
MKSRSRSKSRSNNIAVKTNPKLWQNIKDKLLQSDKGGVPGKWSARKSQLAVKMYKDQGGKYKGSKSRSNSLTKWSNEQWGYSGKRYLPKVVREHLSRGARSGESRRKGNKKGEWVSYGEETRKLMHKYHII